MTPCYSEHGRLWALDPSVTFLNHGSFGACPNLVLEAQRAVRDTMEGDPVQFFKRDLEPRLDQARAELAGFVGADPEGLAFVPNTTTGINTVLRAMHLAPGDELVATTHVYNACRNALAFVADQTGARLVDAPVPFPLASGDAILEAVRKVVTPRTRLVLLDHVASSTGLRFPVETLIGELQAQGIDTLIDGAHAVGMLDLNLEGLGATYYVGNCHKWLCAPKGVGFLHVHASRRGAIRPLAISHGANSRRTDRSRYHLEFDWTGTWDPSAALSVPVAIDLLGGLLPGGWAALRDRNRTLVLEARRLLCRTLEVDAPCPEGLVGFIGAVPLPGAEARGEPSWEPDPLQETLYERYRIEVPVSYCPPAGRRVIRISAHAYNDASQYAYLAEALTALLPQAR